MNSLEANMNFRLGATQNRTAPDCLTATTCPLDQPRQTALPQISFSCEKVPALAVRINSTPCVRQSPVHLLMVIRQVRPARARRFTVGNQEIRNHL